MTEENKETQKRFRDDPERQRAYKRQYYLKNREKIIAYSRKWQAEHPEKTREYNRRRYPQYYAKHGDKARLKARIWNRTNWINKALNGLKSRAKGKPCATLEELKSLFETQQGRCAFSSLPIDYGTAHLDHKIPAVRGGEHTIDNLQWLHRQVNLMKHSMTMEEFENLFVMIVEGRESVRK